MDFLFLIYLFDPPDPRPMNFSNQRLIALFSKQTLDKDVGSATSPIITSQPTHAMIPSALAIQSP